MHRTPLGESLRSVRRRLQWSPEFASIQLQISARHLGQIEAGIRTPNEELLEVFAAQYGIEIERLQQRVWTERVSPRFDAESCTLWLDSFPIHLERRGNEGLLRSIAAALRTMRSLSEESPIYLRPGEFSVLAPHFEFDDPQLTFLMMRYLRLSWTESCALVDGLRSVDGANRRSEEEAAATSPSPSAPAARQPVALHPG